MRANVIRGRSSPTYPAVTHKALAGDYEPTLFLRGTYMMRADGFGWSPDSGSFEVKDNTIYWEDGDITENADKAIFREMPAKAGERYSEWSDEKRSMVKAKYSAKRAIEEKKMIPQDIKTYRLDDEQVELIIEALGTHAQILTKNWMVVTDDVDRLINHLQS